MTVKPLVESIALDSQSLSNKKDVGHSLLGKEKWAQKTVYISIYIQRQHMWKWYSFSVCSLADTIECKTTKLTSYSYAPFDQALSPNTTTLDPEKL